jgi:hypothetical protein
VKRSAQTSQVDTLRSGNIERLATSQDVAALRDNTAYFSTQQHHHTELVRSQQCGELRSLGSSSHQAADPHSVRFNKAAPPISTQFDPAANWNPIGQHIIWRQDYTARDYTARSGRDTAVGSDRM